MALRLGISAEEVGLMPEFVLAALAAIKILLQTNKLQNSPSHRQSMELWNYGQIAKGPIQ